MYGIYLEFRWTYLSYCAILLVKAFIYYNLYLNRGQYRHTSDELEMIHDEMSDNPNLLGTDLLLGLISDGLTQIENT